MRLSRQLLQVSGLWAFNPYRSRYNWSTAGVRGQLVASGWMVVSCTIDVVSHHATGAWSTHLFTGLGAWPTTWNTDR